jgi:hypothetical protein
VFNTTDQIQLLKGLNNLNEITRLASNDRLKIEVKALAGETNEPQIEVVDSTGTTKFSVDEDGDVIIEGSLNVKGTTTQENVVEVQSNHTVTDNLSAGDATSDTHTIKGEWTHYVGATPYFAVDGDTGRIGIGGSYDTSTALKVTGGSKFTGNILPVGSVDIGASGTPFNNFYTNNLSLIGDFLPGSSPPVPQDLGASGSQWEDLWIDGTANIDTLSLDETDGLGVSTHIKPTATNTKDLGGTNRYWNNLYCRYGYISGGIGINGADPAIAGIGINIDTESLRIYKTSPTTQFLQLEQNTDNTIRCSSLFTSKKQMLFISQSTGTGTESGVLGFLWKSGASTSLADIMSLSEAGLLTVYNNLVPDQTNQNDLGQSGLQWKDLYIDGTAYIDALDSGQITLRGDIVPSDAVRQIGQSSNEIDVVWAHEVVVNEELQLGASAFCDGDFRPVSGDLDLGQRVRLMECFITTQAIIIYICAVAAFGYK